MFDGRLKLMERMLEKSKYDDHDDNAKHALAKAKEKKNTKK